MSHKIAHVHGGDLGSSDVSADAEQAMHLVAMVLGDDPYAFLFQPPGVCTAFVAQGLWPIVSTKAGATPERLAASSGEAHQ